MAGGAPTAHEVLSECGFLRRFGLGYIPIIPYLGTWHESAAWLWRLMCNPLAMLQANPRIYFFPLVTSPGNRVSTIVTWPLIFLNQ
jgi:hypothetical protein